MSVAILKVSDWRLTTKTTRRRIRYQQQRVFCLVQADLPPNQTSYGWHTGRADFPLISGYGCLCIVRNPVL